MQSPEARGCSVGWNCKEASLAGGEYVIMLKSRCGRADPGRPGGFGFCSQ